MKRTWLMALAAAAMAIAVGGAATLALFTDTTGPASSILTAGTLEIDGQRDQGDNIPGPMFYTTGAEGSNGTDAGLLPTGLWAPGDEHHKVLQVENIGSLSALLKTVSATLESTDNGLPDVLDVKITSDPAGANVLTSGKLREFLTAPKSIGSILAAPTDVIDLHFWVSMPLATGNTYQNLSLKVSFSVYAEQAANNP